MQNNSQFNNGSIQALRKFRDRLARDKKLLATFVKECTWAIQQAQLKDDKLLKPNDMECAISCSKAIMARLFNIEIRDEMEVNAGTIEVTPLPQSEVEEAKA